MWLYKCLLGIALSSTLMGNAQDSVAPAPKKTFRNFINPDSLPLMNLRIVPIPILTSTSETGVRFGGALEYFFNAKEKPREDLMKDLVNRLNNYGVYIDNSDN